jgi:hypothetical protein
MDAMRSLIMSGLGMMQWQTWEPELKLIYSIPGQNAKQ